MIQEEKKSDDALAGIIIKTYRMALVLTFLL